jgi:hypothetical protein
VAGRTFPAGERGSAAGSLLSSHYPNYTVCSLAVVPVGNASPPEERCHCDRRKNEQEGERGVHGLESGIEKAASSGYSQNPYLRNSGPGASCRSSLNTGVLEIRGLPALKKPVFCVVSGGAFAGVFASETAHLGAHFSHPTERQCALELPVLLPGHLLSRTSKTG